MSKLAPQDFASLELVDSQLREIGRAVACTQALLDGLALSKERSAVGQQLQVIRQKAARARELVADVNVK